MWLLNYERYDIYIYHIYIVIRTLRGVNEGNKNKTTVCIKKEPDLKDLETG